MKFSTEKVEVFWNGSKVGSLAMTPEYLAAFEYDPDFLNNGFSISPFYLPLRAGVFMAKRDPFNGMFGVFNDSLPDGWGMLLTDRMLQKHKIPLSQVNMLDRLCLVGNNGMGAVTYKPAWEAIQNQTDNDLERIALEVQEILQNTFKGNIDDIFNKGGSSGGARPKVLVTINDTHWLIKFRLGSDPENIGQIEYDYSLAAKKCMIEMSETKLFENKYFGTRRFDREGMKRHHILSASGLLNASHRYPSMDYIDLIKATFALTNDITEAYKVYRLMVFNVLAGNKDDHSKNFSFIFKNKEWKLAPAYDLVLSNGFNGQHTTTVAGTGIPTKNDLMEVAKQTGLSKKKANLIFDEVYAKSRDLVKYIDRYDIG